MKEERHLSWSDRPHPGQAVMPPLHLDKVENSLLSGLCREALMSVFCSHFVSISLYYLIGNQITTLMRWYCLSKFAHMQHSEFIINLVTAASSLLSTAVFLWSPCLVCRQPVVLLVCSFHRVLNVSDLLSFIEQVFQWFLITFGFMVKPVSVACSICSCEIWLGLGFK